MAGGLMQLVAYGSQDMFLTGNPEVTLFKAVYKRHTNFAVEAIEQNFNGTADFGKRVSATISRSGDLIKDCYLQVTVDSLDQTNNGNTWVGWTNSFMHALVKEVEVQIGGQRIDRHPGEWFEIDSELCLTAEKKDGYDRMVGKYDAAASLQTNATEAKTFYLPLKFWFNCNAGLALPLIALQYHEVKIDFTFRPFSELTVTSTAAYNGTQGASISNASLWVDYIYLDTDERRRFAQFSHEYLIEQLQYQGDESVSANQTSQKFRLNFNHPCKELNWVFVDNTNGSSAENDWFNFSHGGNNGADPMASAKLLLNGQDRFAERSAAYFRDVQNYQHHTRVPSKHIYTYSFAAKPEEHQPSSSANFSRIDNATLNVTMASAITDSKCKIFAKNYNVLRVMAGMAGLAYAS